MAARRQSAAIEALAGCWQVLAACWHRGKGMVIVTSKLLA